MFNYSGRKAARVKVSLALSNSFYAGCPEGHTVSKNGSISSFFFFFFSLFVVATNLYIHLFIKLSPLLLGMYCSDCLQQK